MEPEDLLNYEKAQDILKKIRNEKIYYSDIIEKYKFGFFAHFQKRNLVITDQAIYSFKDNEIKRRIKIEELYGITYSKLSNQFVVHLDQNDYDYLFQSDNRDKIILLLQNLYSKLKNQDILFCVKHEQDLFKYVVRKKERKNNPTTFKLDKNELISIRDFFDGKAEGNTNQEFNDNNEKDNNDIQEQEKKPDLAPESPKIKRPEKPPSKPAVKSLPKPSAMKAPEGPPVEVKGSGKGVPPPLPSKVPTSSKPVSKNPVDLSSELASIKNNLKHVEVKDYVSPTLTNQEDSGKTTNGMMASFMAQRNKMKPSDNKPTTAQLKPTKNNNDINYNIQIEELKKQLNDEKNKNKQLIDENNNLKEKIKKLNKDMSKIQEFKDKIKLLENDLIKKNNEIQQLLNKNNIPLKTKFKITSIKAGEEIMGINFVSMGNQDIVNYNLVCKNNDLFIRLEERLYEDFPKFKEYETYFEVNGKRIKRFKTLEQNNIKTNDVINIFIIDI